MAKQKSKKKRKQPFWKYFLLTWKQFYILILIWFASVILHNLISSLIGKEEPVFFIISIIIIPLYLILGIVFTLTHKVRKRYKS